jgi:hypothetical protein
VNRSRSSPLVVLLGALLAALGPTGCDWEHFGLVNSIPLGPPQNAGRPVKVFLGLDGVSRAAFDEAVRKGAFAGFATSTLIPMYPATSDASWSRVLHTRRFPGYEYTYYDETQDAVVDPGLEGVLQHLIPPFDGSPFSDSSSAAPAYYKAFDVHASDYFDAIGSYETTQLNFARALDQIFFTLAGRLDTQDVFFAYVLETDVLGHDEPMGSVVNALVTLSGRLREFQGNHPEYPITFTVMTDHGLDHVVKQQGNVLATTGEVASTGVRTVGSFAEGRQGAQPWAIVIEHTRTTYVAVHTEDTQADEVARRISTNPKFDLVVSRAVAGAGEPMAASWPRVSIWRDGQRAAYFAFDPDHDVYWLSRDLDQAAFGLALPPAADDFVPLSDQDLFDATMGQPYPDVFFRARTALEPVSVDHPAQVVASLKPDYVCLGYYAPGFGSAGTAGSHGSLARISSEGILATQDRALPAYTRSDNVLEMFPALRAHIEARHGTLAAGDANAGLAGQGAP